MRLQRHPPFVYHVETVTNVASLVDNLVLDELSFLSQLDGRPDKLVTVTVFQEFDFFDDFAKRLDKNLAF